MKKKKEKGITRENKTGLGVTRLRCCLEEMGVIFISEFFFNKVRLEQRHGGSKGTDSINI